MAKMLKSSNGQAIIELACVLPLILILVLGLIDCGVLFYNHAMITNASREGARAGIVFQADTSGNFVPHTVAEIQTVVDNYLQNKLINFAGATFATVAAPTTGTSPKNGGSGSIDVTVTYTHSFLALPRFLGLGNTIDLSSQTIMRLE